MMLAQSTIVRLSGPIVCLLTLLLTSPATAQTASSPVAFNRDIRPLLSDNCFFCHGPDKNKRQADLRLDTREGLFGSADQSGTIVPGKPEESELIRRIRSSDEDEIMPPPDSHKSLTPAQIELLETWVRQGAPYEGHWAFTPLQPKTAAPESTTSQVIDRFVKEELQRQKLPGSASADRVTLLRRLYFDLLGLPPSPAEAEAFLSDNSPEAYERLVDQLLASPHFGERLAIWWLDLVRYADTVGYHGDQLMSVSPFRDYVIASFNGNKPFNQFTVEQLAGDLLPNPTREQLIASGYNRLGMMSAEGGVQDKEYLAKYIAERVRNASGTWLGITLGCAECHDHKFDPFSTRDFYRFEAFFADIKERGLYAGANDDGNWGPFIKVPTDDQATQLSELDRQLSAVRTTLDTETPELVAAQQLWEASQVPWTPLRPSSQQSLENVTLTLRDDLSLVASGNNPATDTYTLTFNDVPAGVTAFRLEVLPDDSLPRRGPGRAGNGNFVLSEFRGELREADGSVTPIKFQNPSASYEQTGAAGGNPFGKWAVAAALDGDSQGKKWGWAIMEQVGQPQVAIFETASDLALASGSELRIMLDQNLDNPQHTIGCFRLSTTTAPRPVSATAALPANIAVLLQTPAANRTEEQRAELARYFRSISPLLQPTREQLAKLEADRKQLDNQIRSTLITEAVMPRQVRVLKRGNWMDDKGEIVTAGFPDVLAPSQIPDRPLSRLDLANWIVSPENPLTARVTVNRIWKLFFGAGLSRKLDDVGAQGDWPSHPELLDWLANDFRDHNWDVKRLIKAIVMSESYRQSSQADALARETDPYNRWLGRQSRFRIDAELVRDNALAVSGLLVPTIGGRSVFPYQPPGYWAYLNFPTREWQNGSGENLYRRGLYTHWQRQYLHPSLLAFDAPSREECTADRPRSNTPLQSLVLLNDPSYVEAARAFAERVLREGGSEFRQRLDFAFQRALSRPASEEEAAVLAELLNTHTAEYESNPSAAAALLNVGEHKVPAELATPELAAWTSLTRTILNLHEVITRN
jgi:hypothetical protein